MQKYKRLRKEKIIEFKDCFLNWAVVDERGICQVRGYQIFEKPIKILLNSEHTDEICAKLACSIIQHSKNFSWWEKFSGWGADDEFNLSFNPKKKTLALCGNKGAVLIVLAPSDKLISLVDDQSHNIWE